MPSVGLKRIGRIGSLKESRGICRSTRIVLTPERFERGSTYVTLVDDF